MKPPLNSVVKVLRNSRISPISFTKRLFVPESNILGRVRMNISEILPKSPLYSPEASKKIFDIAQFSSKNFSLKFNISEKYLPNSLFMSFVKECKKIFDVVMEIRHKEAKKRYFTLPEILFQLKEKFFPKITASKTDILTELTEKIQNNHLINSKELEAEKQIFPDRGYSEKDSPSKDIVTDSEEKTTPRGIKKILSGIADLLTKKYRNFTDLLGFQKAERDTGTRDPDYPEKPSALTPRRSKKDQQENKEKSNSME